MKGYCLITGGAGFIGTNLADRLLSQGHTVLIFDNLSRAGVERNLKWLAGKHGHTVKVEIGDVRDERAVRNAVKNAADVYHLAAQVAVTTSLEDPKADFTVNALGTLNVLESIRQSGRKIPLLFTSTNKVYGNMEECAISEANTRYAFRSSGSISEEQSLHFCSPYGCSKGTADQYVLDYARSYAMPAIVFRMSCIYGPHQCGNEDQGWVAHFLLQALRNQPITLYGDGKQVRDILYVDDLVEAMLNARHCVDQLSGNPFNMGGGAANTTSLLELLDIIEHLHGYIPDVHFANWRVGDQKIYVSDVEKFIRCTGWRPRVQVHEGVSRLYRWLLEHAVTEETDASDETLLFNHGAIHS